MKRMFVGPCCICEKIIWKKEKVIIEGKEYERLIQTDEGTHFFIKSNYGTLMKIAICKDCLRTLDKPKVAKIISDIVYTWFLELLDDTEMNEEKKRYRFEEIRFFVAIDWAETEEELSCKKALA